MNQVNVHGIVLYLLEMIPVSILRCAKSVVSVPVGVSPPRHTIVAKPQRGAATKPCQIIGCKAMFTKGFL